MPWKAIVGMDLLVIQLPSEMIYYVIIHSIRYKSSHNKTIHIYYVAYDLKVKTTLHDFVMGCFVKSSTFKHYSVILYRKHIKYISQEA